MRRLLLLLAVAAALVGGALIPASGASFNSSSSSTVNVTTDRIQNWLHLYSQSTDPDGLTGYVTQAPGTSPAATGVDATLAVNLGSRTKGSTTTCSLVFTMKMPSAYPTGTSATVTASLLTDPGSGTQPITTIGFGTVGQNGTFTNPVSLGVGQKRQLNLKVNPATKGVVYHPTILITVTYSGLTATYYRYSVPVTVTGG
jgi:hypothetical protein